MCLLMDMKPPHIPIQIDELGASAISVESFRQHEWARFNQRNRDVQGKCFGDLRDLLSYDTD